MGIFAPYPVARALLIACAAVGLTMLMLGELYLLDGLLSKSILRPGRVRKIISYASLLFPLAGWLVVAGTGGLWLFKSPAPAWAGFIEGAIYCLFGGFCYALFLMLISFSRRFAALPPLQRKPRPAIKKRWYGYGLLIAIGFGLAFGLLVGSTSSSDSYVVNQTIFALPLISWPFALYGLVIGCSMGFPFVAFGTFWLRLDWHIHSLSQERFPKVGAALLLLGSGIVGLIFWLIT